MADQLQLRGGTTAENAGFTGAQRELVVDTDRHTLRVHDGLTPGGFELPTTSMLADGTIYYNDNTSGGSAADAYVLAAKSNTNVPSAYKDGIRLGFFTSNPNTGAATANFSGLGVKSIKLAGGADPAAGAINARVDLVYDLSNDWLELQPKATARNLQLRPITAVASGNTMTFTLQPTAIDFRSTTQNSGIPTSRTVTSNLTIVIPNGATLGTMSGAPSRIALLAIPSGSSVALAVVNMAGTTILEETGLINTVAISAASNSANVAYSASAMTGVPYRVMGYADSTQPTAGTWTAQPTIVQGLGGQALLNYNILRLPAQQAATSGTVLDFTNIPVNTKRVTLMLNGVSTSGANFIVIQLGAAGSVQGSGYTCYTSAFGTGVASNNFTNGFGQHVNAASNVIYGSFIFTLCDPISGTWVCQSVTCSPSGGFSSISSGGKTLGGVLDRIRVTTQGGTDSFDLGAINVLYE